MASTSYSQTPSASASTSPPTTPWDVFLSFRGEDTRYTFTDHLYHALHRTGIRTFKDEPGLRSGDVISDSLKQVIQESKTYVVVLSENYASSSWCLDELQEILDCYKGMKRLVVPVFYDIDPSVVRHQIGSFKEAFEKHQTRFVMEKVDKWRHSLKEVADFSGYHISKSRHYFVIGINPFISYNHRHPICCCFCARQIRRAMRRMQSSEPRESSPSNLCNTGINKKALKTFSSWGQRLN